MAKPIIATIDIGSSTTKGIVCQKLEDKDQYQVLTHSVLKSEGVRKGAVVDPQKTAEVLKKLKSRLEALSRTRIKNIVVNINGHHIFVQPVKGAVAISRADQKVSQEDIDRVQDEARATSLPLNKEVLDIYPREYIIDEEKGIKDPLGLRGIKLEMEGIVTCVFSPYLKNLKEAVASLDLNIVDIIPSPIADAYALLTPQQKELGVALIDIGAGTTSMAVFEEGQLIHLTVFPCGSSNISNDIAIALKTEIDIATRIKEEFGKLIFSKTNRKEKLKLDSGEVFVFSTREFSKAARARIEQIFNHIKKELKKINKYGKLPAGVVLTGGGSKIPGLVDYAKKELSLPVRLGKLSKFISPHLDERFSVACGLAVFGLEEEEQEEEGVLSRITQAFRKIIKIFTP
ncbi:cell division protein FtsA [bacterium]|nr:cell division protein FtsA [bacterium]